METKLPKKDDLTKLHPLLIIGLFILVLVLLCFIVVLAPFIMIGYMTYQITTMINQNKLDKLKVSKNYLNYKLHKQ